MALQIQVGQGGAEEHRSTTWEPLTPWGRLVTQWMVRGRLDGSAVQTMADIPGDASSSQTKVCFSYILSAHCVVFRRCQQSLWVVLDPSATPLIRKAGRLPVLEPACVQFWKLRMKAVQMLFMFKEVCVGGGRTVVTWLLSHGNSPAQSNFSVSLRQTCKDLWLYVPMSSPFPSWVNTGISEATQKWVACK